MPRIEAVVVEQLPSGLYRLDVDGRQRLTAHLGSGLDRNFVRLIVGDRVEVEISPRDRTRGRIIRKT
jgi:translation initiation factor IF-1